MNKYLIEELVEYKGKIYEVVAIQVYHNKTGSLTSYKLSGLSGWVYEEFLNIGIN